MKLRSKLVLVGLLLVAISVTGCIGGGSSANNEKQINAVLDRYEKAMVNGDAEGLASLFKYPLVIDGEELTSKEQTVMMYTFLFALMEFEEFEIKDRVVLVDGSGKTATAEGEAHARFTSITGSETDIQSILLELTKSGSQWKISGGE